MDKVPRHEFVSDWYEGQAYDDRPLPIGHGQTISQPFIVALMTDMLEVGPDDVVLEVGTGSGYQAAVLAHLVRDVHTIEIIPELAESARARLERLGYANVRRLHRRRLLRRAGRRAVRCHHGHRRRAAGAAAADPAAQARRPHGDPGRRRLPPAAPDAGREGCRRPRAHAPDPAGALRAADPRRRRATWSDGGDLQFRCGSSCHAPARSSRHAPARSSCHAPLEAPVMPPLELHHAPARSPLSCPPLEAPVMPRMEPWRPFTFGKPSAANMAPFDGP